MKTPVALLAVIGFTGLSFFFVSCGGGAEQPAATGADTTTTAAVDPMADHGIGPVTSIELAAIDTAMAAKGKATFDAKCMACHKVNEKLIGPALAGVTTRRAPEWIMNMMLNTAEMLQKNEAAKTLMKEHNNVPMINNELSQDQAREVLEYLRTI